MFAETLLEKWLPASVLPGIARVAWNLSLLIRAWPL